VDDGNPMGSVQSLSGEGRVVLWRDGGAAVLSELGLHLDPARPRPWAFVSHGHADHVAKHGAILCSEGTAEILRARYPALARAGVEFQARALGESFPLGGRGRRACEGRLLAAGHVLGSAMLEVRRADGASLLFTGDFKLRPGLSCEVAELVAADVLVMETTFGHARYRLPPAAEIWAELWAFIEAALEEGAVPVLLAYSLGKAQEALCFLGRAGWPAVVHPAVEAMSAVYRRAGIEVPECEVLKVGAKVPAGRVVVWPPSARRPEGEGGLVMRRAMLSGWGMGGGRARYRYGVERVVPLSDHADYGDLLEAVERVDPELVLTMHGYAREFAADLRMRGREAWQLVGGDQLELGLEY